MINILVHQTLAKSTDTLLQFGQFVAFTMDRLPSNKHNRINILSIQYLKEKNIKKIESKKEFK